MTPGKERGDEKDWGDLHVGINTKCDTKRVWDSGEVKPKEEVWEEKVSLGTVQNAVSNRF